MRAMALFAAAAALTIAAAAGILALVYDGAADRRAVLISAGVAYGVQLLAFAIVRLAAARNVIAGWGLGAIVRFAVFVVYALVIVDALGVPSAPALVSLALCLFASTLIEPLFLTSDVPPDLKPQLKT